MKKNIKNIFAISLVGFFVVVGALMAGSKMAKNSQTKDSTSSENGVSTSNQASTCIISVDGVKYDVTGYRKIHEGGDVFVCGTDMTQAFYKQHDARMLNKMAKYKI